MMLGLVALVALNVIAAAERVEDLNALVAAQGALIAAQGRQLEQMQQQLQSQAAAVEALELAAQQGTAMQEYLSSEPGRRLDYLNSEPGRRLSAPATQKKAWHHSVLHTFDVPASCGLHADLDSDATGPMSITRSSDGNVTMGYGGSASATQPAAFEMNHPANCRTATLTSNHPLDVTGSLSVTGINAAATLTLSAPPGGPPAMLNGQPVGSGYGFLRCRSTQSGLIGAAGGGVTNGNPKCAAVDGVNIAMYDCNMDHGNVMWMWLGEMLMSHSRTGGSRDGNFKCMNHQISDGNVMSADCNNLDGHGNSQEASAMYFYFDGEQIKNRNVGASNRKCMQCGLPANNANNDVRMYVCDGSANQRWYWYRPGMTN